MRVKATGKRRSPTTQVGDMLETDNEMQKDTFAGVDNAFEVLD